MEVAEVAPGRSRAKVLSGLGLLLVLALSAFLQFSVVTRSTASIPMVSDAADYFSYAYNLKHFGVYSSALSWTPEAPPGGIVPDSLRSPGYPLFLLAIPGLDTSAAYLHRVSMVQAMLGIASVWFVFLIAARFLRPGWSHLAAAITAISPHLANISTYLLTESLFLFFLLASIHVSLLALRSQRKATLFAAGLLWGVCGLVRPTVLLLPPLFVLSAWLLPTLRSWRVSALIMAAGFFLVQAPWLVRNQVTPMDPEQGSLLVWSLHHGSYPNFMYNDRPESLGWPFRFDPDSERAERDLPSVLADICGKFREHPLTYAKWYLLGKPGTFLSWGYVQGTDIYVFDATRTPYKEDALFSAIRSVALYLHWPLMLLGLGAALGIFVRPRWFGLQGHALVAVRVVAIIVLYAIGFHMIVAPYPRYGVPFRPLLYILAVAMISAPFTIRQRLVAGF
ncbi:MAG: glycosyltransferase family 39 protein [Arenimonas sp.]|jgi:hypothetical protein